MLWFSFTFIFELRDGTLAQLAHDSESEESRANFVKVVVNNSRVSVEDLASRLQGCQKVQVLERPD